MLLHGIVASHFEILEGLIGIHETWLNNEVPSVQKEEGRTTTTMIFFISGVFIELGQIKGRRIPENSVFCFCFTKTFVRLWVALVLDCGLSLVINDTTR